MVALQNGGGIRNNSVFNGNISELDTFNAAAFENFVTVVEDIPLARFKQILEHSIANTSAGGQFGQWAGVRFTYDPTRQAQVTSTASGSVGQVLTEGQRILDVFVMTSSGEIQIIDDGVLLDPGFTIDLASIDFLVRTNGDAYPFSGLDQTNLGVSYQQALLNYMETGLNGVITGDQYPVIGLDNPFLTESTRRIDAVPEPTAVAGLALLALAATRRRRV
jgi:5'-nucleotidase